MSHTPPQPAKILTSTKKPAIILVHGFRGSPSGLEAIARDLRAAGYEVHLPALPPFAGAKFKPTQQESIESNKFSVSPMTYAKYLRDYCDEHNLIRPILIGHSMGSIVVATTAKHYPERVNQKLFLLSPISTKPSRIIARISPLASHLPGKVVDYVTTKFLFVKSQNADSRALFRETLALTHQCSSDHPPTKPELSAAMNFSTNHSVADFLGGLTKNVIMITGAKDRLISKKSTEALAAKHSAALEFIPDSGHLHNYEKPSETAALILKYLHN